MISKLKTCSSVKQILKKAREQEMWTLDNKEPLRRASKLLDPNWKKEDYFYPGVSHESWKFFLYGKRPINADIFKAYCQVFKLNWEDIAEPSEIQEPAQPVAAAKLALPPPPNLNFVGREEAIAQLNTRINQGAKLIVIQGPGGVGKTTLAKEYLKSQGFDLVVELLMAKEKENITPVESAIEEWLKQDFQEEPGREFGITLARLKRQLQIRRVGILIDNLEPALDGQGRFIEPHRRYVELLRVLADSSLQSVTLITSREPLAECGGITNYSLPSLNEQAWQDFFSRRDLDIDATTLREMHKAYGGNALAMNILCAPIQRYGGMVAYWQEYQVEAGLLVELAVKNLVEEQFKRLEEIYPEAYKLLCRLGCYRYQDVPTVPTEGLLCLLWDVPERQKRRVIESLRNLSLVECQNREYWLHPVIREEAIARLRESEYWEEANRKAAEFWFSNSSEIQSRDDSIKVLESLNHYSKISAFDKIFELFEKNVNLPKSYEKIRDQLRYWGYSQQLIDLLGSIDGKLLAIDSQAQRLGTIGVCYYYLAKYRKSLKSMQKAEQLFKDLEDCYYYSWAVYYMAKNHLRLGNFPISIKYFNQALEVSDNLKNTKKFNDGCEIRSLNGLGSLYCNKGEYKIAIDYLQKALKVADSGGKQYIREKADALAYLAEWYLATDNITKAIDLTKDAIDFFDQIKDHISEVFAQCILCQSYLKTGNFVLAQQAIDNVDNLSRLVHLSSHNYVKTTLIRTKALFYFQAKMDTKKAIDLYQEAIEISRQIGAKCDLAEAYYQLALTYQKMGVIDQSQENFDKAIQLFEEMEAPKQVEKVRRAIGFGGDAAGS
ncbi:MULTISPECIES: tetratricopeptide repeat protein [unclassified Microcoleus]|uniref:tetratricopeptide repeat protein n=1 Tax=unclassified Microcoleus TaxID=2642155 RepID=UPI002FD29BF1